MLKHHDLTLGRIKQWLEQQLQPLLIGERVPLEIEWCSIGHFDQDAAQKDKSWESVAAGFQWGPAYTESWFRLKGQVPTSWAGREVVLIPEVGGERTLWQDNVPQRGVDREHRLCRLFDACKGGEPLELYIQAHATAPHVRVWGDMPEPEKTTETVKECDIAVYNTELQPLVYDIAFALSLLKAVPKDDPGYATILTALNACCNEWANAGTATISICQRLIRDAYSKLDGRMRHTIYPLGHAHLDTAWLWPLRITHLKMAHTTATQLYHMDRYGDYVYVHSQASQYEWLEQEAPALLEKVKEKAKSGQWEPLGSMWVEADCNLTGSESLVRQFLYGKRYFAQHFGIDTVDMFLPDVFGYSAALPQILNKFGIRHFLTQKISWNQFNKFPHNTFWWQGIDGTKIWTHFPPADTYCGMVEPDEIISSVRKHRDQARSDSSMYLFGFGDGGGGPTERQLEFLKRAKTAPYMPQIDTGKSARNFYEETYRKSKDLCTWSGELYFELHRGTYTSQAANKKLNRESEFLMRDVEWLHSVTSSTYPQKEIEKLWKLVLLNQFHDIIPGSSVTEVYEDSDKDYELIKTEGTKLLQTAISELAPQDGDIAIFHNASLTSQVTLPWEETIAPTAIEVNTETIPAQLVDVFGQPSLIFGTPRSAMGQVASATYSQAQPKPTIRLKTGTRRLENKEYSVRFDAHGNITSIRSLGPDPIEFIQPGELANVFQIMDDHPGFWEAWDIDVFAYETVQNLTKSDSFELVEKGPVRAAFEVVRTFGNSKIIQRISLGPTPGIRFDTTIHWHESRKLLKVAFPLNINTTRATYEIQFGSVERPTHKNTSWDMAKFEVCAQKWVDMSEGDYGVALLNNGKYGHDADGNVLRMSLLRAPKSPDPTCDMGVHHFTYCLLPHFHSWRHADVVAAAYALNAEPRVVKLEKPGKPKLHGQPYFKVDRREVVIETVKKAEDTNHVIVRMYEAHNTRGTVMLTCAQAVKRAWVTDLNETNLYECEIFDGCVNFDILPYEIVTLKLEF